MGTLIIKDRRHQSGGKSTGNRQKFLKRVKGTIQTTGHNMINGNVGSTNTSGSVNVSKKTLDEPSFVYHSSGYRKTVLPGNYQFVRGDEIELGGEGSGSGGSGNGAGNGGENGEDGFSVEISRDEFLDYFFEDLELPNMKKTDDTEIIEYNTKSAGFITDGPPSRLSILESKKKAKLRKMALTSSSRKKVKTLELELDDLLNEISELEGGDGTITPDMRKLWDARTKEIEVKIEKLQQKIKKVPALEEIDLRFRSVTKIPVKTSSAVIFFIMDNSGSMGEEEKTLARKFFTLMYLFVQRKYGNAELVFISHTSIAREMDEEEFFNTRESGGTVVSTALKLCSKIIAERYSAKSTNIYVCQASDGDNYDSDSAACFKELAHNIIPRAAHFSYIQVGENGYYNDTYLWGTYSLIAKNVTKFAAEKIRDADQIYPVFRNIFKKQSTGAE